MPLPPLPQPDFPVYGLDAPFPGDRWLALWNGSRGHDLSLPDNRLAYVHLGHGDVNGHEATVMVSTHAHRERWSGPSIDHAAGDAAIWMGERAWRDGPDDDDVQRRLELGRQVSSAGSLDGPPWMERVGQVDGQSVAFRFREEGDAWAAVVALGQVSVGVAGWGYDFTEYPLSVVDPYSYRLVGYDLFRP